MKPNIKTDTQSVARLSQLLTAPTICDRFSVEMDPDDLESLLRAAYAAECARRGRQISRYGVPSPFRASERGRRIIS